MAAQNRDIRIFLGSPGDVTAEREMAYRVIQDIQNILDIIKDYYSQVSVPPLRAIGWEQVPPGVGLPNDIILDRFRIEESDIFVFILWKRFGSPPGTRRKSGSRYSSGTQEEFERAYLCNRQNASGKPLIMVYQKKDEFSIASLSPKEIGQYRRVVEFMEDCGSTGKHSVLTRSFLSKDFEGLLRRNLLDTILRLSASKSNDAGISDGLEIPVHEELSQESGREENPAMTEWLTRNNLSANPFKHYVAENEEDLIKYYVPFKGLSLISNDIVSSDKNWLFFGVEGSGKTALKQFISSRCAPLRAVNTLAIPYETSDFLEALTHSHDVNDIELFVSQQIFHHALKIADLQAKYGPEIKYLQEPATIFMKLGKLLEEEVGYQRALCLLDLAPTVSAEALSKLIDVLAQLVALQSDRVSFRIFLPKSLQVKFMRQGRYLGKCDLREIQWEEKELKELIKRRMIYYSINKSNPNQALGPLCESKGKTVPIDEEIVKLAEGNPRAAIWLANKLFMEHCQSEPVLLKIESRTWDRVQLDWWTTGRNLILGAAGRTETFFAIGNDVYFKDKPLKLSKRSKALLKRLVDADGQTCSKDELIRTGWPDVRSQGVSEAALREAIRRLKGDLKDKNKIDPAWVETQHDQGYRLLEPESGTEKEKS